VKNNFGRSRKSNPEDKDFGVKLGVLFWAN
jgi:hypothetical protein